MESTHADMLGAAFRTAAGNSNDALLITTGAPPGDPASRIAYANPAFLRLAGYDLSEVVGESPRIFHGPETDRTSLEALSVAPAGGGPARARLVNYAKDGAQYAVDVSVEPVTGAGDGEGGWIATYRSVGERRSERPAGPEPAAAEAAKWYASNGFAGILREALEHISVGLCLYGPDHRLVVCNRQQHEFFAPVADLLVPGERVEDIVTAIADRDMVPDARGRREAWVREWLGRFDDPSGPFEIRLTDGRWLSGDLHKTRAGGVIAIWTDVTALKDKERILHLQVEELQDTQRRLVQQRAQLGELAENLTAARDEAERANRTKSEFLANMSHELRSPLNAIIGFAEILCDEMFGPHGQPQYKEYAGDIKASGAHLLEVINDILDLSKIEAGKLELQEDAVDVAGAVESCSRLMATRAWKARVRLETDVEPNLPAVFVDSRKLKQILLNLLSNAVKFTPQGGTVTTAARIDEAGRFQLKVADTGIGIAPEDMKTALSAFGQVERSLTRKHEGTGLGLPLTKALVELHGGTFVLKSTPGEGTDAIVTLPSYRVVAKPLSASA